MTVSYTHLLLSWVTEKMQQALRTLDIQYQDLPQIYRCVQHLSAIETTLQPVSYTHLDVYKRQVVKYMIDSQNICP